MMKLTEYRQRDLRLTKRPVRPYNRTLLKTGKIQSIEDKNRALIRLFLCTKAETGRRMPCAV